MTHHPPQPTSPTRDEITEWLTRPFSPPRACPIDALLYQAGVDIDPLPDDQGAQQSGDAEACAMVGFSDQRKGAAQ